MRFPTPTRIARKTQSAIANLGVHLIARSGIADGYWRPWRGEFFNNAQKCGLHILPVHYYSPIPDTRTLKNTPDPLFDQHLSYNTEHAWDTLNAFQSSYRSKFEEFAQRRAPLDKAFTFHGSPYHPGEAEILYAMVHANQPKQIIEIGCGYTTLIIAEALADARADNPEYSCHYSCVEPYRPDYLSDPPPEVTEFLDAPIQSLTPERIAQLEPGDILFIDSTHVVCAQSDVVHEILRLLPALNPGVLIHVHDIFLPFDYPPKWLNESRFFWTEQYLLYAYLLSNSNIEIVLPLHNLYRQDTEQMNKLFPSMAQASMVPSAFWLRTR